MEFTSTVGAGYQTKQPPATGTYQCSCGAPYIQKVSNSDKNPGRNFWACSGKPYCRGWHGWVDEGAPKTGGSSSGGASSAQKRPRQNDEIVTRLTKLQEDVTEVLATLKKARVDGEQE